MPDTSDAVMLDRLLQVAYQVQGQVEESLSQHQGSTIDPDQEPLLHQIVGGDTVFYPMDLGMVPEDLMREWQTTLPDAIRWAAAQLDREPDL